MVTVVAVVGVNDGTNLAGDLRGRRADQRGLGRIDLDLDLRRRRDQVALEVREIRVGATADRVKDRVCCRARRQPGLAPLTTMFRLLFVKPAVCATPRRSPDP